MVYRRPGGTAFTFQARTRHGWHPVTTPTTNKALALRIEAMWEALAREYRAWDLLEPILEASRAEKRRRLGALYDAWTETRQNVAEIRRRQQDVDLVPLVTDYLAVQRQQSPSEWPRHVERYLRYLLPAGTTRPRSTVTPEWLSERLYVYGAGPSALRQAHSVWSGFFGYCQRVRGLFPTNPMLEVARPKPRRQPIRFAELEAVKRIVGAQPTAARRAFMALVYGTGIERAVALPLTRAEVAMGTREIRAAGTKAHTRDRVCMVADWAWVILEPYLRPMLPAARIFPADWTGDRVSHWHLETVRALALPAGLTLHGARHHWAVMRLRAGTPIAVVQHQLGHSTPMLTLTLYGAFIPTGADRRHWERETTAHEAKRRGGRGAK